MSKAKKKRVAAMRRKQHSRRERRGRSARHSVSASASLGYVLTVAILEEVVAGMITNVGKRIKVDAGNSTYLYRDCDSPGLVTVSRGGGEIALPGNLVLHQFGSADEPSLPRLNEA